MKKLPMSIDILIGKRIKMARMSLGISMNLLADSINVTHQQMSKYEKGINRITCGRLSTIAKALGKEPGYFFSQNPQLPDEIVDGTDTIASGLMASFLKIKNRRSRALIRRMASVMEENEYMHDFIEYNNT
jgi:transcriptional regulator with XRE-family HTH domain